LAGRGKGVKAQHRSTKTVHNRICHHSLRLGNGNVGSKPGWEGKEQLDVEGRGKGRKFDSWERRGVFL